MTSTSTVTKRGRQACFTATAHLMGGFYRNWREGGQDKAAALRNAMDETRQARSAWAHTRYWGAFTLVGDWR